MKNKLPWMLLLALFVLAVGQSTTQLLGSRVINGSGTLAINTSGTITSPNSTGTIAITSGNIATATALAADPADCGAGTKATAINASGTLTCSAVSLTTDVSGTLPNGNTTGVTASTASTLALRDTNGSAAFNREKDDYTTTATAGSTTTLAASATKLQFFTGATTQIVKLPATSAAGMNGTGEQFLIRNTSSGALTVQDSAAGAVATEAADSYCAFTVLTVGSPGTWNSQCWVNGAGGGTVTSVAASVPSLLSIAGSPVTTSGTLAFTYSGTALPTANGGTSLTSAGTAGNRLVSDGTNWASQTPKNVDFKYNVGFSDSVGSNNWTVAITQSDGSTNCSASAPCMVAFRSSTAASSAVNVRSITGALSQVITLGTGLGTVAYGATAIPIYIYLLDSDGAGTMKIGISTNQWREDKLLPTTLAESFATSCTQASPSICTSTAHGMTGNMAIQFTGTISGGFSTGTTYYTNVINANSFNLSAAIGGANINKTSGGTQTPTVHIFDGAMVSDAVYANVPIRMIGKVLITETTVATWASAATTRSTLVANTAARPSRSLLVNSTCTSSPCSVSDTGDVGFVEQCTRSGAGIYNCYFPPNLFTNAPICQCNSTLQADSSCEWDTPAVSNVTIHTITASTGAALDARFSLTCWEAR